MPPASAGSDPVSTGARTSTGTYAREHLLELLGPVVHAIGYDLEDVTVTSAGRRSLVRVIIDADGGVDLDAIAGVSQAISAMLDDDAPGGAAFAGPFVLEVSSPGVDRPLVEQRHWRRAIGRLVSVPVGERTITGRVLHTSAAGVTLDTDGGRRELGWDELGRGRIQVEFHRVESVDGDREGG
jgi:ribosome maturation factor RimP